MLNIKTKQIQLLLLPESLNNKTVNQRMFVDCMRFLGLVSMVVNEVINSDVYITNFNTERFMAAIDELNKITLFQKMTSVYVVKDKVSFFLKDVFIDVVDFLDQVPPHILSTACDNYVSRNK